MAKIGNLIRKGLENIVAPVLIGVAALGSYQEAKAHTNDPSFYIMYAMASDVNFADSNTLLSTSSVWHQNYNADPLNTNSLNILVGSFINTGGTNSPPPTSEMMRNTTYAYYLTDITQSNKFSVLSGIVATNGIWQGNIPTTKIVDTTINGTGYYDNNQFVLGTGVSVAGNSLSSAIQISLNYLNNMNVGDSLTFQTGKPTRMDYVDLSAHRAGFPVGTSVNLIPSGSITFIPEPSTYILLGGGLAALAWRRRKRNGEKADNDLISAKAQEYAEDRRRR